MRHKLLPALMLCLSAGIWGVSCNDDVSGIGGSLAEGEIGITVDSAFTVSGSPVYVPEFDARSGTLLLGNLKCPEYGTLESSFVARLMPASSLDVPDTITEQQVDSMKLKLHYRKGAFTGDSITPMQLKVFRLTRQLPSDIKSSFDPKGYYDSSAPLGVKSYAATALGMKDSLLNRDNYGHIQVRLPLALAREIFKAYRTNPEVFQWPSEFAKYFPGIYVQNSFGSGNVVNITVAEIATYYRTHKMVTEVVDGVGVNKYVVARDSVTLLSTAPEVLSSNVLRYNPSPAVKSLAENGEALITAPGGYMTRISFPAQAILDRYWKSDFNLAVINNLVFTVPAEEISNSYGITPPPYLLMVKTKDLDSFFAENRTPDSKSSFWATYDTATKQYTFTSMREYIVGLMKKGASVEPEDADFTILAVNIVNSELVNNQGTIVTKCVPFLLRPAMCRLNLDEAKVKFTFSSQYIP